MARSRKDWIRNEMTEQGVKRAAEWGWPNIYTYTKSMGDQLVARETGIVRSIVRPAIVESSLAFPFPGWNEGLHHLGAAGLPGAEGAEPAAGRTQADPGHGAGRPRGRGDADGGGPGLRRAAEAGFPAGQRRSQPASHGRVTTLTGLYKRQRFQDKETGNKFLNELAARMEFRPVTFDEYDSQVAAPGQPHGRAGVVDAGQDPAALGRAGASPRRSIGSRRASTSSSGSPTRRQRTSSCSAPSSSRTPTCSAPTTSAPCAIACRRDEQALLPWSPETIDCYDYLLNIHFPGLQRWVLPELDADLRGQAEAGLRLPRSAGAVRHRHQAARHPRGACGWSAASGRRATATPTCTSWPRGSGLPGGRGVAAGERVMLFGRTRPSGRMAYFGILKADATVVPVGHESSVAELVNVARASGAVGRARSATICSRSTAGWRGAREAGMTTRIWPFAQVFALPTWRSRGAQQVAVARAPTPSRR